MMHHSRCTAVDMSKKILEEIERAYLELTNQRYGIPVPTSPRVWGHPKQIGLYEKLLERGLKISWEEFKEIMMEFNNPEWYGIVYVTWAIGKTNRLEPLVIAIYAPISKWI